MRPMCSDFFSPMFFQLLPPSSDLYIPSPHATERCALFSPVPSHTTAESFGSSTTVPTEYEPSPSKTGVHVVPALMVFHNPPDAAAAEYSARFLGFTAKATTRPLI